MSVCSLSVMISVGLAAISHNSFGRHASRRLVIEISFNSICSNLALRLDFLAMKFSISSAVGVSTDFHEENEKFTLKIYGFFSEWETKLYIFHVLVVVVVFIILAETVVCCS